MQMRTKLAIVTVIGAGALLIAALAVFIASRPQIAYAQNSQPTVQIGLNNVFGNATRGPALGAIHLQEFPKYYVRCERWEPALYNVR